MAPAPEALVLLLDAPVTNDERMMRCLLRPFPSMAKRAADLGPADSICDSFYTNHFYVNGGTFGLVIEDRPTARALVKECNLDEHIFWGGNTDPVQLATIADIVDIMHKTSPKDSLLALMKDAPDDDNELHAQQNKKPRPKAATVEADDLATADRLTSIAWLLKSLGLWPKDVDHGAYSRVMTAEITDRVAKVRDVEVLSAFITEYIDDFDAVKLRTFVTGILLKKRMIQEVYKFPDGDKGPLDYWEKAYAAAKSSEWAKLLAEEFSSAKA